MRLLLILALVCAPLLYSQNDPVRKPAPKPGQSDIRDGEGYAAQARRPAVLGCEGKWAIHPSQIDIANDVFSPSEKAVKQAQAILDAMEEAQKQGRGAVTLDGKLIDFYPDRSGVLAQIEPVYETLPGWNTDLSHKREPGDLPDEAKAFLAVVEAQVGVPVRVVGVGAERDDYLLWNP